MLLASRWKLDEALELIRALQPTIRKFGYHLCLGGGVLNKGESEKDLDLYFLPMGSSDKTLSKDLVQFLCRMWKKPQEFWDRPRRESDITRDENGLMVFDPNTGRPQYNAPAEAKIFSFMGKFNYSGLRIDVFVYGGDVVTIRELYTDEEWEEEAQRAAFEDSMFSMPQTTTTAPAQPWPGTTRTPQPAPPPGEGWIIDAINGVDGGTERVWSRPDPGRPGARMFWLEFILAVPE